jgi:hypothetical protein
VISDALCPDIGQAPQGHEGSILKERHSRRLARIMINSRLNDSVDGVPEIWPSGHAPCPGCSSGCLNFVFVSALAESLYAVFSYSSKTA